MTHLMNLTRLSRLARPALNAAGLAAALLLVAPLAQAELLDSSATRFTAQFRTEVSTSQANVWQALSQPQRWWSDQHTWSGSAANLAVDLQAGGCWCERWADGQSAMHGQVVWVKPGQALRLNAALGPLQDLAVNGVLTLITGTQDGKTVLRLTYRVSGPPEANLLQLAPVVDKVLAEQWQRLLSLLATGRPN